MGDSGGGRYSPAASNYAGQRRYTLSCDTDYASPSVGASSHADAPSPPHPHDSRNNSPGSSGTVGWLGGISYTPSNPSIGGNRDHPIQRMRSNGGHGLWGSVLPDGRYESSGR